MLNSIVEYYAEHEGYSCGYCKNSDTNYSHGLWAHAMTVSDYQDLIDRGWRRSGKYCYKPTMDVTCCPMYTIRCRALEFKPSKSQKKVLNRFNKYLMGQYIPERGENAIRKMSTCSSEPELPETCNEAREEFVENKRKHQEINIQDAVKTNSEEYKDIEEEDKGGSSAKMETSSTSNPKAALENVQQKEVKRGSGPDPTKTPCKKAKQLRSERKLEKIKDKGIDVSMLSNMSKNKEKQIEDFINDLPEDVKHKLEIKLVRTAPPSPEWEATAKETHRLYVKYQMTIHGDKIEKCAESKFKDFLVESPLLVKDTIGGLNALWHSLRVNLWVNRELRGVHCKEEHSETGPPCGYGSFHQQYWLDGKIIGVGVIDILPKCVSSVYFFYDPKYMNLTLGTYAALREIAFTRQLYSLCPELKYYYMGYYIHSCIKMRYKGNFYPSDLACPETYKWLPLKDCIRKLEESPYSRLDPDIDSVDNNYPKDSDVNYIPVWVKGVVMPYKIYARKVAKGKKPHNEGLVEYARLVGAKSAKSLILFRA